MTQKKKEVFVSPDDSLETRLRLFLNNYSSTPSISYMEQVEARKSELVKTLRLPDSQAGVVIPVGTVPEDDQVLAKLKEIACAILSKGGSIEQYQKFYTSRIYIPEYPDEWFSSPYTIKFDTKKMTFVSLSHTKPQAMRFVKALKKAPLGVQLMAYRHLRMFSHFRTWEVPVPGEYPDWDTYGPKIGDYFAGVGTWVLLTADPVMVASSGEGSYESCHAPGGEYQFGGFPYASDPGTLVAYTYHEDPTTFDPFEVEYFNKRKGRQLMHIPDLAEASFVTGRAFGCFGEAAAAAARDYVERNLREALGLPEDVWKVGGVDAELPEQSYNEGSSEYTRYTLGERKDDDLRIEEALCPECGCVVDWDSGSESLCCLARCKCDECGCSIDPDEDQFETPDGGILCVECADEHYPYCPHCHDREYAGGFRTIQTEYGEDEWCDYCSSHAASECIECGELVEDTLLVNQRCEDCQEEEEEEETADEG